MRTLAVMSLALVAGLACGRSAPSSSSDPGPRVTSAPPAPAGALVFSTRDDLRTVDVATGTEVVIAPLDGRPRIVAHDHTAWCKLDDGGLVIRRDAGQTTAARFADHVEVVAPDGKTAVVKCQLDPSATCIGDLAAERVRRQRPIELPGYPLAWGAAGLVVSHTLDDVERGVVVVDPSTGATGPRVPLPAYPQAISPDGAQVVWFEGGPAVTEDARALIAAFAPVGEPSKVTRVPIEGRRDAHCRFARDVARTLLCVAGRAPSGPLALIAIVPGQPVRTLLDGLTSPDLVVSPDGHFAAVRRPVGEDDQLVVVALATGQATDVGATGPLRSPVAWLTDGPGPAATAPVVWPDALPPVGSGAQSLDQLIAPVHVVDFDIGRMDLLDDPDVRAPLDALLAWAAADGGLPTADCTFARFDHVAVRYTASLALGYAAAELDHPHLLAVFYLARRLVADGVGLDELELAADLLDELRGWATQRRLDLPATFATATPPADALARALVDELTCLRATHERYAPLRAQDYSRADLTAEAALLDSLEAVASAHPRDRAALVAEVTAVADAAIAKGSRHRSTTFTATRLRDAVVGLGHRLAGSPVTDPP